MSTQTYLLPTLYSLLPSPSYLQTTCRLSLQSLHVETLTIHETIYTTTHPIIPGQHRSLHLRARARSKLQPPAHVQSQRRSEVDGEKGERKWEYELVYLSSPLSAREYSEMSVRACVSLDVVGSSTRLELEDFVKALGFEESHSFTRTGLLFHIPTPTPALNLHLTITRLHPETWPPAEEDKDDPKSTEPFLVELQPARPVQAVPSRGEVGLQDTMRFMRTAAGRVDGLEWSTGR